MFPLLGEARVEKPALEAIRSGHRLREFTKIISSPGGWECITDNGHFPLAKEPKAVLAAARSKEFKDGASCEEQLLIKVGREKERRICGDDPRGQAFVAELGSLCGR